MPWGRQTGYHYLRDHADDGHAGEGLFAWARRQLKSLLKPGSAPAPATILYTHAIDEELGSLPSQSQGRSGAVRHNPYEGR